MTSPANEAADSADHEQKMPNPEEKAEQPSGEGSQVNPGDVSAPEQGSDVAENQPSDGGGAVNPLFANLLQVYKHKVARTKRIARGWYYFAIAWIVLAVGSSIPYVRSPVYWLSFWFCKPVIAVQDYSPVFTPSETPEFAITGNGAVYYTYRLFKKETLQNYARPEFVSDHFADRPALHLTSEVQATPELHGEGLLFPFDWADASSTLKLNMKDLGVGDYCLMVEAHNPCFTQSSMETAWFRISNLGLITKYDSEKAIIQALDLNTRKPLSGVRVQLLHAEPDAKFQNDCLRDACSLKELAVRSTNADGLVEIRRAECKEPWTELCCVAAIGPNRACDGIIQYSARNSLMYRYQDVPSDVLRDCEYRYYIETDRPIYRLGQRVYYKGTARVLTARGLTNPGKKLLVNIKVTDPEYKELFSSSLNTDASGSFNGFFDIKSDAHTGRYSIEIEYPDETRQQYSILVEQYRRPEYEVTIEPVSSYTVAGNALQFKIKAQYYFGAAVQNANIQYTVSNGIDFNTRADLRQQSVSGRCEGANQYMPFQYQYQAGAETSKGETVTDSNGEAIVSIRTAPEKRQLSGPYSCSSWERTAHIEADVTDASRKTVHAQGDATITASDFLVLVHSDIYPKAGCTNLPVSVATRTYAGAPVAGKTVRLELCRWQQLFGFWWRQTITEQRLTTSAGGTVSGVLSLPKELNGEYFVVAETSDSNGRTLFDVSPLYATAIAERPVGDAAPSLELDKRSYMPGDTAQVLIRAPLARGESGEALLSVESTRIQEARRVILNGPETSVRVPIPASYAPRISIALAYIGAQHHPHAVYSSVPVSTVKQVLQLLVKSDKTTYRPGKSVRYEIKVTDSQKRPIAGAELALNVYDESLRAVKGSYARSEYMEPEEDVCTALFKDPSNEYWVQTRFSFTEAHHPEMSITWFDGKGLVLAIPWSVLPVMMVTNRCCEEQCCKQMLSARGPAMSDSFRGYSNARTRGDELAENARPMPAKRTEKPLKFVSARTRRDFKELAAWIPHLVTDSNGVARATVTLPDDLTTWRACVYGVTEQAAGFASQTVTTSQELIARLSLPRFFTEGDKGLITALVHNYSPLAQTVRLSLNLSPSGQFEISQPLTRTVSVGRNGQTRLSWPVKVHLAGTAKIKLTASGTEYADALEQQLPVRPFAYRAFFVRNGVLKDQLAAKQFPIKLSPDAQTSGGSFSLSLAPSTIGPVLGDFSNLIEYPYGCTEQTMSRLEPSVVAMSLHGKLNSPLAAEDLAKFQTVYNLAITKLYSYQHPDGGWGWWKEDKSNPYLTAKVLEGMFKLRELAFGVDSTRIEQALPFLSSQSEQLFAQPWDRENAIDHAYIEYVLSLYGRRPSAGMTAWHMVNINRMSPEELAYMTMAMQKVGQKTEASTFYKRLLSLANVTDDFTDWDPTPALLKKIGAQPDYPYSYRFTPVEATALCLRAVAAMEPENNDWLERVTRWIILQHDENGWNNTKCTAEVFQALLEKELAQHRDALKGTQFQVSVAAGKLLRQYAFESLGEPGEKEFRIPLEHAPGTVALKKDGSGWLYYTSVLQYDRPLHADGQLYSKCMPTDMKMEREFYRLVPGTGRESKQYRAVSLPAVAATVNTGDLLLMRVKIHTPVRAPYVMVESPLPSGAEVVSDVSDITMPPEKEKGNSDNLSWPSYYWTHHDVLDDRLAYFASDMPQGDSSFSCVMRMEMPGQFNINPATLQAMYSKQVRGYSTAAALTVH